MNHGSEHQHKQSSASSSMLSMGLMMMLMCLGMVLVVSIASAVGGPIAWALAAVALVALGLAHMKLMRH